VEFPISKDEFDELGKTIEAMLAEIDVALWQLAQLEKMVDGGAAASVAGIKFSLRNASGVASEAYSNTSYNWSEGFPWNYKKEALLAYMATRENIYGAGRGE